MSHRWVERRRLAEPLLVLLGCFAVAAAVWWPLLAPGDHAALDPGDPAYEAWNLDWVGHAITDRAVDVFDANIFHPEPDTLAYSDTRIAPALLTAPLAALGWEPVTRHSWALVIGTALNAAAAYWAGTTVWRRRSAGVVAATVFAFGPFPVFLMYHLHMVWRWPLALALVGVWRLADHRRDTGSIREPWGLAALVAAASAATLTSVYQTGFLGLVLVVAVVVRLRDLRLAGVGAVAAATVIGALPGVPAALAHLRVARSGEVARYGLESVTALGGRFLRVDERARWWSGLLGPATPADRLVLPTFPGVVAPVMAIAGTWVALRRGRRAVAALGVGLVVVGGVLALGAGPEGWRRFTPMALLFRLPLYEAIRGAGRYWVVGLLGLALLAGGAATALVDLASRRLSGPGGRRRAMALAALPVAVLLLEGLPDLDNLARLERRPLDHVAATTAGAIVYLPLNVSTEGIDLFPPAQIEAVYRATAHRRPMPNGYSGTFPASYLDTSNALRTLPSPEAMAELRRLGITEVIVTRHVAGTPWEALRDPARAAPLVEVARDDDEILYRIPPSG